MPIRHCQKCGLKVLIDDSQTTANPFYCQRCAATAKAGPGDAAAEPRPMVSKRESASAPVPTSGPAPAAPGKGGPVKVLCPYCKASFSGRLPLKPAKGACPVCQKELVLLPDGKIKPAATFDLAKWQKEQELLKYADDPGVAEQARAVQKALERSRPAEEPAPPPEPEPVSEPEPAPEPEPVPEPPSVEPAREEPAVVPIEPTLRMPTGGAEPSIIAPPRGAGDPLAGLGGGETMLDMGRPSELDDLVRAAAPHRGVRQEDDPLAVLGNEPPVPGNAAASHEPADDAVTEKQDPIDPLAPSAEVDEAVTVKRGVSAPQAEPSAAAPAPAPAAERPRAASPRAGAGKHVFGGFLLLLPIIAGAVCLFVKNEQLGAFLGKVGAISTKGFRALYENLKPEPPDVGSPRKVDRPPEKQPDTPATPVKPAGPDKAELERDLQKQWEAMRSAERNVKVLDRNPNEDQKRLIVKQKELYEKAKQRYAELQAEYRKHFGAEYNPADR